MWNGNAVRASFILALSIGSLGGCDNAAEPGQSSTAIHGMPGERYQLDRARNRAWFLTRDGVVLYEAAKGRRVTVALPEWTWAGEPHGCFPDLALGPKGEVVVTSDVLPILWRIDPESLVVSVHPIALNTQAHRDVGFSRLVYLPQHAAFLAARPGIGTLWKIDPLLTKAQEVPLSAPTSDACGGAVRQRVYPFNDLAAGNPS